MEIQVHRLRTILDLVGPSVSRKGDLPAATMVYIGEGQIRATNLEVATAVAVPEATDEPFVLPYKTFSDAVKHMPGRQVATLTQEASGIRFSVQDATFVLHGGDPDEFPPTLEVGEEIGEVDGDAFLRGLAAVLPYASTESSRPVLTGVAVTFGDTVEVAGADGFRLAWQELPFPLRSPNGDQVVLPSVSVSLLQRLWKNAPKRPANLPNEDTALEPYPAPWAPTELVCLQGTSGKLSAFLHFS